MTFQTLGLSQPVLRALALKGYDTPSPIQAQAIPPVLEGRDLLGIAQTGTGKTAAFMLPSIDRLVAADRRPRRKACRMLVLAPTRELAGQIAHSARDYAKFAGLSIATVFGGTSLHRNRQDVARGVDVLIATPGRLVDLTEQNALDLGSVEVLVLDEADQMLDLGFVHALRHIVRLLPKERQTLFFSATMPKAIRDLAGQYLSDPVQVAITPAATTAERVDQYVVHITRRDKQELLARLLRKGFANDEIDRVLVFTRTKHGADRVVTNLGRDGIEADAIHGNKSQPQRERALGAFRKGRIRVLVATDIAARGIDVSGVSHVINYELPNVAEQYVHRIGRTARAGADGIAVSFCDGEEMAYLRDIERLIKTKVKVVPTPEDLRADDGPLPEYEKQGSRSRKTFSAKPAGAAAQRGRPQRSQRGGEQRPASTGGKPRSASNRRRAPTRAHQG